MNLAKIDTAKTFLIGPVLDADGVAVTTGLTRANINVSKNGSVAASNAFSTLSHSHTGHWIYAANAADISALGEVEFSLDAATNSMAPIKFQVVTANIYDTFCSTDNFDVDLVNAPNETAIAAIQNGVATETKQDLQATLAICTEARLAELDDANLPLKVKEINQSLNGQAVVIDRAASTFKVYDTDGETLLFTITKTSNGYVDTLTRT